MIRPPGGDHGRDAWDEGWEAGRHRDCDVRGDANREGAMTVARALLVLLLMVAVGVAVVIVRGESAKAANRIQRLHQEKIALEQQLWAQELELAKLRGPEAIRRRAEALDLEVVPPAEAAGERLD